MEAADNQTADQVEDHIAVENPVAAAQEVHDIAVADRVLDEALHDPSPAGKQIVLFPQEINRQNKADEVLENPFSDAGNAVDDPGKVVGDIFRNGFHQVFGVVGNIVDIDAEAFVNAEMLRPVLRRLQIVVQVAGKEDDAVQQLGQCLQN